MGEMADYYRDQEMGDEFAPVRPPTPTTTTWVTKDNRVVRVVDMSDDHLRNTIRMLRRREELIRFSECMAMGRYQETAPDGAYDAIEWELSMIEEMDTDQFLSHAFKCYPTMLREAERRQLNLEDA